MFQGKMTSSLLNEGDTQFSFISNEIDFFLKFSISLMFVSSLGHLCIQINQERKETEMGEHL